VRGGAGSERSRPGRARRKRLPGVVLLLAGLSGACQDTRAFDRDLAERECIEDFRPGVDYFPDKSEVEYAELFDLSYHEYYKVLTVRFPTVDGDTARAPRETFVLLPCGAPQPSLAGALAGAVVVPTPARTVSVTTNEDLGMVVRLGFLEGILSTGIRAIYPDEVVDRFRAGIIADGGGWGSDGPHVETLLDLSPDLVLMGVFGGGIGSHAPTVRSIGLSAVPTMIRVETTPLGRAEWVKAIGAFFHAEETANRLFGEISSDYEELSRLARARPERPTAFWASTYAPGEWTAGRNNFQARFLEDAGATNVLADEGYRTNVAMRPEAMVDLAGVADFWITENTNMIRDGLLTVAGTPLAAFAAYRNDRVFHLARRYRADTEASDYNFTGPGRPDLVLRDLVALFHPELLPDHEGYFTAKLGRLR